MSKKTKTQQAAQNGFNRQRLIDELRSQIETCDFMKIYGRLGTEINGETVSGILVVAQDRDLPTVASFLVDGVSGYNIPALHASGDLLGIYESWGHPLATFDVEPGDEVRAVFAAPVFIVQRTGRSIVHGVAKNDDNV